MHIPREVWKLREPNVKQEFARLVTDRKDEVLEADNVESKWNAMKGVWQKATEHVCGWTKGPSRYGETWCWNDEVAKAIEEKRNAIRYGIKPKQQVIGISIKRLDEMQGEESLLLRKRQGKSLLMSWRVQQERQNVYRVAKQMTKSRQGVVGVNCVKDANGKVLVENDQVKEEWRKYMEKLLNENAWNNATTCEKVEGPCELIRRDEILKAGIVSEMFTAEKDYM